MTRPAAPTDPRAPTAPHPAVIAVPAFADNYIWLVLDRSGHAALAVDPGDAAPVLAVLRERGLRLAAVLVTHHHRDHAGGLPALREAFPDAVVVGPAGGTVEGLDREVRGGDVVEPPGFDARFEVLEVPGHTLDHIAYRAARVGDDPRPVLFCGDTLFAGGCGRLFEGTAGQMHASLARLADGPDDTLVFCAHEYTASNLRFARAVEPGNAALAARDATVASLREAGRATVPSSLGLERATNPFLRTGDGTVRRAAAARLGRPPADEVETLAAIRAWKDVYKG